LGYSFAAGTTDGVGSTFSSALIQGQTSTSPFLQVITQILTDPDQNDIDCHFPKPVLLKLGSLNKPTPECIDLLSTHSCAAWTAVMIPIQVVQLGQLVIPAVPSEWTTMVGRRLRKIIASIFTDKNIKIPIAGLSNV